MKSEDYNKSFLKASLEGRIDAYIYDEENNLKKVVKGKNLLTDNGVNRLVDMLIDGYNYFYPKTTAPTGNDIAATSTLKGFSDFNGGKDGEIFGINFIEWSGKCKSTFSLSGYQNTSYFIQTDNMFDNDMSSYSRWYGNYNSTSYWNPGGEDMGYICDLGITTVTDEIFNASTNTQYYNVQNKNLYYGVMSVKSEDGLTTYTEDTDYVWQTGDGDTYGSIKILNASLVGVNLKIGYKWYDVPQVPIVGFAICAGGSAWGYRCFFNAWRWSLDQGQSRTAPFFPNVTGVPSGPGWQTNYSDRPFYPTWHASNDQNYYFQNSLPWAVKNPVQLAWFGNHQDQEKFVYDFQLLGLKMPKLGAHAIGLGTGSGIPTVDDTDLFNLQEKVITEKKPRMGTSGMKVVGRLDYDEGNGKTFTEVGLYYPSDDNVYFKKDSFYTETSGEHSDYISGSNMIMRLDAIEPDDCDTLMSHAMFDESWSKTSSERVELVYNLSVYWG